MNEIAKFLLLMVRYLNMQMLFTVCDMESDFYLIDYSNVLLSTSESMIM